MKSQEPQSHSASQTPSTQVDLAIEGMHCASCVVRVEKAIQKVEGVQDVAVNLIQNSARVTGAPSIDAAALLAAVGSTGYKAKIRGQNAQPLSGSNPLGSEAHSVGDHAHPAPNHARHFHEASHNHHAGHNHHATVTGSLIPPVILSLLTLVLSIAWPHSARIVPAINGVLAGIIVFGFGRSILVGAWKSVLAKSPGMDSLIAVGTVAAYLSGIAQLIEGMVGMSDFVAASLIILFQLIGRNIESSVRRKMASSIEALNQSVPATANVLQDGAEVATSVDHIKVGDTIVVRPGETFAIDGTVIWGSSYANEAVVTGESMPVAKEINSPILQGGVNGSGLLHVRVSHSGAGSTIARIAESIQNAQLSKIPLQRMADQIAAWFVPSVFVIALVAFALFFWRGAGFWGASTVAISVLVVACPCALGIAIPAAIAVASGKAADLGILFRDAASLESATAIKEVIFDKTGTLTQGKPTLTDSLPLNGADEAALAMIAVAESGSEHPIAIAIRSGLPIKGELHLDSFQAHGGKGIEAVVDGHRILIGTASFLSQQGVGFDETASQTAGRLQNEGKTTALASIDGKIVAAFGVSDAVRPEAVQAIQQLNQMGIKTAILSGDRPEAAQAIAAQLGIEDVSAGMLPEGKLEVLKQIVSQRAKGEWVAMVGDGVNDAPALALADIGIAMGEGTGAAIGAASVTLLHPDLRAIPNLIRLSRATKSIIRQNLWWAFGYNGIMLILAFGGWMGPATASGAMALSSLTVSLNSLRLRRFQKKV